MTESGQRSEVDEAPPYLRGIAYVNGEFVPAARAKISIFDHSFLYGDGAFESIAVRSGHAYALEEHIERLYSSCGYLAIEIPLDPSQVKGVVEEIVERNGYSTADVRIVVSRGEGYPMSDPRNATRPLLVVSAQQKEPVAYPPERGLRLGIVSTRRTPAQCLDPRAKTNNYLNHIVAKLEALAAGADDAIMLSVDGHVAELPGCNIFTFKGGTLASPPAEGTLSGITRSTIIRIAESGRCSLVREVAIRLLTPLDLYTADEVFVTGTGTGVAFVREVDGRRIGAGVCGPVTACFGAEYTKELEAAEA